jgi:hypothetical protein
MKLYKYSDRIMEILAEWKGRKKEYV